MYVRYLYRVFLNVVSQSYTYNADSGSVRPVRCF